MIRSLFQSLLVFAWHHLDRAGFSSVTGLAGNLTKSGGKKCSLLACGDRPVTMAVRVYPPLFFGRAAPGDGFLPRPPECLGAYRGREAPEFLAGAATSGSKRDIHLPRQNAHADAFSSTSQKENEKADGEAKTETGPQEAPDAIAGDAPPNSPADTATARSHSGPDSPAGRCRDHRKIWDVRGGACSRTRSFVELVVALWEWPTI